MSSLTETPVVVLGAGGHAKVVISTMKAVGLRIAGVFDDNPERWGSTLLGVPIVGSISQATAMSCVQAVIAVGDNRARREIAERVSGMTWLSVVHPRAYVDPSAVLGPGTVVFAGAVVQPDTVIGAHVIINTGATVDHDCRLGDFVHVAPGTHLSGGVTLEDGVFLGVGSAVIPGRSVGPWSRVGAGGVVISDLPGNITAIGVPARVQDRG